MKGATWLIIADDLDDLVSIHAPNEGSDLHNHFPRYTKQFQSTLPMKGATRSSVRRCGE